MLLQEVLREYPKAGPGVEHTATATAFSCYGMGLFYAAGVSFMAYPFIAQSGDFLLMDDFAFW